MTMEKKNQQQQPTKEVSQSPLTGDLKNKLQDIAFKNSQIKQIMDENASLKKQLGNRGRSANRKQSSGGSAIPGLARLGSSPDMPGGYSKKGR
jgi:translation initiation factor IF-3